MTPIPLSDIHARAERFTKIVRIGKRTRLNMAQFMERLADKDINVCIDPVADDEWFFATDGICTPHNLTIRFPESTYYRICNGEEDAIGLLFHELGHLMLGHVPVMHNERSSPSTLEEDSEWQADCFSSYILCRMGLAQLNQLRLDF